MMFKKLLLILCSIRDNYFTLGVAFLLLYRSDQEKSDTYPSFLLHIGIRLVPCFLLLIDLNFFVWLVSNSIES